MKRKSFKAHGVMMFLATLVNLASILVVMVPVALNIGDTSLPGFNFLFRSHIVLGLAVIVGAAYIVADWRFKEPGPTCFQRKKWMLTLTMFWIAELVIGMMLYMKLYI